MLFLGGLPGEGDVPQRCLLSYYSPVWLTTLVALYLEAFITWQRPQVVAAMIGEASAPGREGLKPQGTFMSV